MRNDQAQFFILPSIAAVVSRCSRVFFHPELVRPAVEKWGDYFRDLGEWQNVCHFFDDSEETVRWIFVLDILNHCFWPDVGEPTWTIHYGGSPRSGYWGLAASLKRAQESGIPITQPDFLANLSADDLKGILSGNVEIPLFEERLFNLREAGRILNSTWRGDIIHLLESAKGNALVAVKKNRGFFSQFSR